jgi:hypothetical protein
MEVKWYARRDWKDPYPYFFYCGPNYNKMCFQWEAEVVFLHAGKSYFVGLIRPPRIEFRVILSL